MPVYGGVDPSVRHHRIGDPEGVEADLSRRPPAAATSGRLASQTTVVDGGAGIEETAPDVSNMPGTVVNVIRTPDSAPDADDDVEAPTEPDDPETPADGESEAVTGDAVVPVGINAKDMRKWIGSDTDRARAALEYEDGLEEPRQSVIRHAESVLQE